MMIKYLRRTRIIRNVLINRRLLCHDIQSNNNMSSRLDLYNRLSEESKLEPHESSSIISVEIKYNDKTETTTTIRKHTTVEDILLQQSNINKKMLKRLAAVSVNGTISDLSKPLTERENYLELHDFESVVGTEVMWHSASHILGYALEKEYGDKIALCDGPALRVEEGGSGFFYELRILSEDLKLSPDDIPNIESHMKDFIRENHRFERLRVSKEDAMKMFQSNRLKKEFIENINESEDEITLYRCGDFVDLCRGPHVPRTGLIQAHKLLSVSGAHHDDKDVRLSRVYGIAFENRKRLRAWEKLQEDAKKRDHRRIGALFVSISLSHPTSHTHTHTHITQVLNKTSSCFTKHLQVTYFGYLTVCIYIKNCCHFFEISIDLADMTKYLHLSCLTHPYGVNLDIGIITVKTCFKFVLLTAHLRAMMMTKRKKRQWV